MRDPERIDRVLDAVRRLWERQPNWRLGELIVNTTGEHRFFYTEDDQLLRRIEEKLDA